MKIISQTVVLLSLSILLSSCGGGGGGGSDFVGAANVSIQATPNSIDTGDNSLITTQISDVHQDGIALKFSFPAAFVYVANSAQLIVDDNTFDIGPKNSVTQKNTSYLVFYLDSSDLGESGQGQIQFQLEAKEASTGSGVGVDPDVDDPQINNSTEFDSENPEFSAEDFASLEAKN